MRIYIAGPCTGLPSYNYPAFHAAAEKIAAAGHEPINPARREIREDWTWADYMRPALRDVADAEAIALLDGWRDSRGARIEVYLAEQLDIPAMGIDRLLRQLEAEPKAAGKAIDPAPNSPEDLAEINAAMGMSWPELAELDEQAEEIAQLPEGGAR